MNDPVPTKRPQDKPVCMLCGPKGNVTLKFVKDGYNIFSCSECGLMFVFPRPLSEELLAVYDIDYYRRGNKYLTSEGSETQSPSLASDAQRIEIIKKYRTSGKLLDVGCAMGGFLTLGRQEGFEVHGVEVSEVCVAHVKEQFGIHVHKGDLPSVRLSSNAYEIVCMWDVLEHLSEPSETLSEAHRILRPGGLLFVSTGDSGSLYARIMARLWHLLTPPQHLFFFTRKSLAMALSQNGFVVRDFLCPGKYVNVDFLFLKARETFGSLVKPLQFVARALGVGPRKLYINLYDIMTCIAQKAELK